MSMQRVGPGQRPLYDAACHGHRDVAGLLIANGAVVDGRSLSEAVRYGYRDVVKLLIAKGVDVNAKDNDGKTPLALAKSEGHEKMIELLRRHGAEE